LAGFDDRIYLDLLMSKSIEVDAHGNYIIEAEASNENLDYDGQVVLQRALMDSKDYFLKNGVISWDHLHLKNNDPGFIIGEPLSVEKRGTKTIVKAILYKGNKIAEDVVAKLRNGSTIIKTSVGGRRPVIVTDFDTKLKRAVEKVASVLWDELAITFKPVNQTLSPVTLSSAAFVKSLSMGYTTDSATATGGAALGVQDLQGADKRKKAIHTIVTAIAVGDVRTPEEGLSVLAEAGVGSKEGSDILEEVVNRRKKLQEVFRMDANLTKSFDDAIDELEKAMKGASAMPPAPMPAPAPKAHVEPDADNAGGPSDGDEDNEEGKPKEGEEEGEGDEGEMPPAIPPTPPMKKSGDEEEYEFLDVSPVLASMAKSLKSLRVELKTLQDANKAQGELLKSIGNMNVQSAQFLKSLADQPGVRKSVVSKQERFGNRETAENGKMSPAEILRKSTLALNEGKISLRQATVTEDRVNKGLDIESEVASILKSL